MKIKKIQLTEQEKTKILDALYTTISALKGRESTRLFLRDLLTESERIMLGRRIIIARKLLAGEHYDDIIKDMRVGQDTINRVYQWLTDTAPGYEEAIQGMRKEMKKRDNKRRLSRIYGDPSWRGVLAQLKDKYPLHFLLFPSPKRKQDE